MMQEEFNYLEETRSIKSDSSSEWVKCIVSQARPSYEDVRKLATKKGKEITKRQYEKACRDLGLK
jgi:hypothetical protein